jgi:hypothetical protein
LNDSSTTIAPKGKDMLRRQPNAQPQGVEWYVSKW